MHFTIVVIRVGDPTLSLEAAIIEATSSVVGCLDNILIGAVIYIDSDNSETMLSSGESNVERRVASQNAYKTSES